VIPLRWHNCGIVSPSLLFRASISSPSAVAWCGFSWSCFFATVVSGAASSNVIRTDEGMSRIFNPALVLRISFGGGHVICNPRVFGRPNVCTLNRTAQEKN
jgi:hypothetical protein